MKDADIIESVNDGYLHFWMNPKNKWRNKIYEASQTETEIKNQHKIKVAKDIRESQKDLLRELGLLRDMRL